MICGRVNETITHTYNNVLIHPLINQAKQRCETDDQIDI